MATSLFGAKRRSPAAFLALPASALGLAIVAIVAAVTPTQALDFAAGIAFPRGFYENALGVQAEYVSSAGFLPGFLIPVARLSGYVASRDQISLAVGSGSLLIKARAPESISNPLGFRPYVAVGPSVNYLYSWADLGDFGTESTSKSSVTLSAFAGVEFFPGARVSIFGEARQTFPSEFTFDYVIFGLKYNGSKRPSIE